jgi:hypothetical protein
MRCVSCLTNQAEEVGRDAPWRNHVCSACGEEAAKDFWVYCAVLETDGRVVSGPGLKYSYVREHWAVTFDRTVLENAFSAKSDRALYAELYRWHRDPAYAYPPATREWVKGVIDVTPRSRFERFSVSGESAVSVLYTYDGSGGREFALGLGDYFPRTHAELLELAGISESTFPGKHGLDWMRDLFGAEFWGQTDTGLRFRTSIAEEVVIPARLVNLRAEGQIRQIIGRSAASSA